MYLCRFICAGQCTYAMKIFTYDDNDARMRGIYIIAHACC